ncbi:MAG: hypothetical protein EOM87_10110, partial [Clostridia bacterium]|nr:hypothetical protein [Clostridia bacterium]
MQSNSIINAGVYNLVLRINYDEGGVPKQVDKEVNITVNKVNVVIAFDNIQKYYKDSTGGALAHYVNKPASVQNSSLKYAYYEDIGATVPIAGIPENAGIYYVKAYYQDNNNPNYTGKKIEPFTVHKSEAVITAQSGTVVYSGENFDPKQALSSYVDGIISSPQYSAEVLVGGSWKADNIKNVGIHSVRFHFAGGDGNYENPFSETYNLTVSKADTHFVIEPISFVYNGAPVDISTLFGSGIALYNTHYNSTITSEYGAIHYNYFSKGGDPIAAPTLIGEYDCQVICDASSNYNAAQSAVIALSITKKPITFEFDGNFHAGTSTLTTNYSGEEIGISYTLYDSQSVLIGETVEEESIQYSTIT